jgi:hypothetical protein
MKHWTIEDESYLMDNWAGMGAEAVARHLGRSLQATRTKHHYLDHNRINTRRVNMVKRKTDNAKTSSPIPPDKQEDERRVEMSKAFAVALTAEHHRRAL